MKMMSHNLLQYVGEYMVLCYLQPGYVFSTVVDNHTHRNSVVECYEHSISSYAIPDLLHIGVYAYCFYLFRLVKTEQLQILMEKVAILKSLLCTLSVHYSAFLDIPAEQLC